MATSDDELTTDITIEGDIEEIERFAKVRRSVPEFLPSLNSAYACQCYLTLHNHRDALCCLCVRFTGVGFG